MAAREGALRLVQKVLSEQWLLDEAYRQEITDGPLRRLTGSDRAFAKRIVTTLLQHLGEIDWVLEQFMDRGMPKKSGPLRNILRIGVAELLFLKVPAHAVVDSAVSHYRTWRKYAGFKGLTNAVLRRIADQGLEKLDQIDPAKANLPDWVYDSWCSAYGEDVVSAMMAVCQNPSTPLDLSLRQGNTDEARTQWTERLGAEITPTGSLRLQNHGKVDQLEGYAEGEWWVQDAAATLPVSLLGDLANKNVLDLCAAPGGKTLQLAAAGASVTSLDLSSKRMKRVQENLDRVGLEAKLIAKDLMKFKPEEQYSAILLDAPCSATGTMRRHPELIHQRTPKDIAHFASLQAKMLDKAAGWLAPDGIMIFCTCSLQPQEGPELIADFLMNNPDMAIEPIAEASHPELAVFLQPDGSLRTRPDHWAEQGGMDGFYIIQLRNLAKS